MAIYGTTFTMSNSSSDSPTASQTSNAALITISPSSTVSTTVSSSVVSSIPLTTTSPPPLSCIGRYTSVQSSITSGSADRLFVECQPWHQGNSWTITYSPGMCPGPMTAVSTAYGVDGVFTEICCKGKITRLRRSSRFCRSADMYTAKGDSGQAQTVASPSWLPPRRCWWPRRSITRTNTRESRQ
jgi:hypothetical protein